MPEKENKDRKMLPPPLPEGEILTDVLHRQWKLGPSIGVGGFGEIYMASPLGIPHSAEYAIKIVSNPVAYLFSIWIINIFMQYNYV